MSRPSPPRCTCGQHQHIRINQRQHIPIENQHYMLTINVVPGVSIHIRHPCTLHNCFLQLFHSFFTENRFLEQCFAVHDPGTVSHRILWEGIRSEVLEASIGDDDARFVIIGNAYDCSS